MYAFKYNMSNFPPTKVVLYHSRLFQPWPAVCFYQAAGNNLTLCNSIMETMCSKRLVMINLAFKKQIAV